MINYTQQTDRIRDKTTMARAIKEVKQGMFIQSAFRDILVN